MFLSQVFVRDSNDGEEMNKMKLKGVMSGHSTTEMWGENSTGCLETVNCGVSSVLFSFQSPAALLDSWPLLHLYASNIVNLCLTLCFCLHISSDSDFLFASYKNPCDYSRSPHIIQEIFPILRNFSCSHPQSPLSRAFRDQDMDMFVGLLYCGHTHTVLFLFSDVHM